MGEWIDVSLRGFVTRVQEHDLVRNGKVRAGSHFLWVDYYLLNDEEKKGIARIYISNDNLGMGRKDGIVYYPSNDPMKRDAEFLTAIANPTHRFMNQRVGFIGKMRKASEDEPFDIVVSHLAKVKIFPDPETYLIKK